jgi:hypothetical protein
LQKTLETVDLVTIAGVHVDLEYLRVMMLPFDKIQAGTTTHRCEGEQKGKSDGHDFHITPRSDMSPDCDWGGCYIPNRHANYSGGGTAPLNRHMTFIISS